MDRLTPEQIDEWARKVAANDAHPMPLARLARLRELLAVKPTAVTDDRTSDFETRSARRSA